MNSYTRIAIFFMLTMSFCCAAVSGTDIGPFDLPLVSSTPAELAERFPSATQMGINRWSGGPMYRVNGKRIPLQGAKQAVFIFDSDDRLSATLITLRKNRFTHIRKLLDAQYRKVSETIPHVGNRHVRWESDDVVIELDSPHMSFEMELGYHTAAFLQLFEQGQRDHQASQRQQELDQL